MDVGFAFLSALFHYSIISQYTHSVAANPKNFHIIEDQARVDELASKHAKYKSRWTTARKLQDLHTHKICEYFLIFGAVSF